MNILSWFVGIIIRPTATFFEMDEQESLLPALVVNAILVELFEVVFIVAILINQTPSIRLVLPISPEHYYLAQIFFGPAAYLIGLVLTVALIMILGREAEGEGKWRPMTIKICFAVCVPLILVLWPLDFFMTVFNLGFSPMGIFGRTVITGIVGLVCLWISILCIKAIVSEHHIPASRCMMIFFPSVISSMTILVLIMR